MCALYGFYDLNSVLPPKVKKKLLRSLSCESEIRGHDATGIAYISESELRIFKVGKPAHKVKLYVPDKTRVVMGHDRATTHGLASRNQNNHPFRGHIQSLDFALAHNGLLWDQAYLRKKYALPDSEIETDSYVAVQMIEKSGRLDIESLKEIAENIEGSFAFTILDSDGRLIFIKKDCPISIAFFDELCLYVYASTSDILHKALVRCGLGGLKPKMINLECGDIFVIHGDGDTEQGKFKTYDFRSWVPLSYLCRPYESSITLHELLDLGRIAGVDERDIQTLLELYTVAEVEEFIDDPKLLQKELRSISGGCWNDDDWGLYE